MTNLVTVNGVDVSIERALGWRAALSDNALVRETAKSVGVVQYAAENGISVNAEEIQNYLNEMRYVMEIENAEETKNWMAEDGISEECLRESCEIGALLNKIRLSITDEDLQEAFSETKATYEYAELYSITVEEEDLAAEIRAQLDDGEDSFYNLAVEHSVDAETSRQGGFVGETPRESVRGEAEAAIFAANDGDIIGPIKEGDDFTVYMVKSIVRPSFDDVKESMRDEAFEELVESFADTAEIHNRVLGTHQESPSEADAEGDDEDEE